MVHFRRFLGMSGTDLTSQEVSQQRFALPWLCAAQHTLSVLCMLLPVHTGSEMFFGRVFFAFDVVNPTRCFLSITGSLDELHLSRHLDHVSRPRVEGAC